MKLSITDLCRELRKNQTPAEKILWQILRNRRLADYKFLRQHPLHIISGFGKTVFYIPDFYCYKAKLVIEADGSIHQQKIDYDKNRDEVLKELGIETMRFLNEDILNNAEDVINRIINRLRNA